MTVLVDRRTRVVVQGITGREGRFHTRLMLEYGTRVVAGVTPGKGGETVHGVPVYDTVEEAVKMHDAEASIVFVPAPAAADAVYEAIDAGLRLIVVITEHIPVQETMLFIDYARRKGTVIIGPNTPGIIAPGKTKIGIMPGDVFAPGHVAVLSRSGTLTYEVAAAMTREGIGQSIVIGVGGDPVVGLTLAEAMEMLEKDSETQALVLIGEIGGDMEERAARMIREGLFTKPVVAYIAGKTAPPGKRMGHAGAIISMGSGSYGEKVEALRAAGVQLAQTPYDIPKLLAKTL
ncbi:Succinyl-CoA ligase [ADP-forming] alpha chain [Pyrodictium delaneyi]|uniref:Succinate--CoA ligase [ADP-forming] subunit alpha n=1 Tax=Pyrodictium delaneyi TaxID=1273541 RepID=A0A0P0N1U3_9CREN|nr:succinate--CoA ligase subunit alpha [Pyrodictium delaneyi]ALL00843.1 Succinyl-CoA ligase [ADP-forming] alpha chain [Pyrodictium delaneyi]OWJ55527.1 succinate--CoA ligase subunit alpha [Pyrodictium delaneyi]